MSRAGELDSEQVLLATPSLFVSSSRLAGVTRARQSHVHIMSSENLDSDSQLDYEDEKQVGYSGCCLSVVG